MQNQSVTRSSRLGRRVGVTLTMALVLAACVSAEPPPADVAPFAIPAVTLQPSVPPEPVTDTVVEAIEAYWEARDASFAAGSEAGIAFIVANNHPNLPYTADECREAWFGGEAPVGFSERTALLGGSIESDPGWTMVQGPLAARDLGAGLFTMVVAFSYEGEGLRIADRVANVHLQVVGGNVRQFLLCEQVDVIVVQPTAAPAAAAGAAPAPAPAPAAGTPTTVTPGTTPTTPPVIGSDPITLPPITATPSPVGPGGGGSGTAPPPPPPPPPSPQTGTRPPGSGIDFCNEGDPGAQPVAGDNWLCPDTDVDNERGEDGGSSEPDPAPGLAPDPGTGS